MSTSIRIIPALVLAALVAPVATSPPARADTAPVSLAEAYRQIKDAERSIPVPTPEATTNVGTFDAATGEFDGLATEIVVFHGKPTRIVPQIFVNAVNSTLVFGIVHATQSVRVSVAGVGTAFARAGATSVSIDVGRLDGVRWTIRSGTKAHPDELKIDRPSVIGAGAFTIRALPVAVVYDSPQDPKHSNSV